MLALIRRCERLVFSPKVLTETSNLSRYIAEPLRSAIARTLAGIMEATEEVYVPSARAAARAAFGRLGLTDAVLPETACAGATLLTEDVDLHRAALNAELPARNFNHVRDSRPDFR